MKLYKYLILLVGLLNITATKTMDGFSPESKALFQAIERQQGEGFFDERSPLSHVIRDTPRARKKIVFCIREKSSYNKIGCTHPGCIKRFSNRSHRNRHVETAHNKSQFWCDRLDCTKSFPRLDTLKEHKLQVHDSKNLRYLCTIAGCQKKGTYGCRSSLVKHLRRDHDLEMRLASPEYRRLTQLTYEAPESDSSGSSPSSLDLEKGR